MKKAEIQAADGRRATPAARRVRALCQVAMGAAVMAVCAFITVPFSAVPFTMQTFGVFLILLLLGGKKGTAAVAVYLALGAAGAPVFSGFRGGFSVLVGPTGGYLWGFLALALLYLTFEKLCARRVLIESFLLIGGLLLCYAAGTLWFLHLTGRTAGEALLLCVVPYVLPDLLKLYLACFVAFRVRRAFPAAR